MGFGDVPGSGSDGAIIGDVEDEQFCAEPSSFQFRQGRGSARLVSGTEQYVHAGASELSSHVQADARVGSGYEGDEAVVVRHAPISVQLGPHRQA
ncbi:hypothetical protein MARA_40000 [Mycolicibacterium arabiense]|uniref:Uncharacterized protein n=1 Tax=Mycolicibacterium arabiense TaxID=1286181 RepID=A0A7I7S0W8_9MYCO|nr:hypothetical protein MARA_40000 [Mycolicibacterium arabiense]